jgi:NADH-quinone oxidoreductase subunit N
VAITAHSQIGTAAAMFYLAAYAFMNAGAFAVVTHVTSKGERLVHIDDLAGLARRQPAVAGLFCLFLFSLIGVPLTGGFLGKFYIFKAALDAGHIWLTVLGLLNSAVAAYYYLRLIVVMYFHEPDPALAPPAPPARGILVALWSAALATLVLGIFPTKILEFADRSAAIAR